MMESEPLEAAQPKLHLEALRAVAQTASRAAAGGMTRALRRRVTVAVPEFALARADQLPAVLGHGDQPVVAVSVQFLGDLSGSLLWIMASADARRMGGALLDQPDTSAPPGDEEIRAVLMKGVHIMAAAYAEVLSSLTTGVVFLSVPELTVGSASVVLSHTPGPGLPGHRPRPSICVGSRLSFDDRGVVAMGHVVLMPHHPAFDRILRALPA